MRQQLVRVIMFTAVAVGAPMVALAQSLSGVTAAKNAGNSPDSFVQGASVSHQRTTSVSVTTSTAQFFRVRYREVIGTDTFGFSGGFTESADSDYTVAFNVTAPGAYLLAISTSLNGAFTLANDGATTPAHADLTGVTGTATGGQPAGGTLDLMDPGRLDGFSGDLPIVNLMGGAAIAGISNGLAKAHTLRFTWSGSCTSDGGANGAECAVRLGDDIDYANESAGDYPGVGSRTMDDDGHFVTVKVQSSTCGNQVIDGIEECDVGSANGAFTSCCTATCELRGLGQVCRPVAGPCDAQESCTGTAPTCPGDGFLPSSVQCRASGGQCDVAEHCTGAAAACPNDVKLTTACRAASGICDAPESCDGINNACPPDQLRPTSFVCRASVGACDIAETCNGVTNQCPLDQVAPVTTVCRPSAGVCDPQENCNGTSSTCPADAKSTAQCHAVAGICDLAENCNGVSNDCPPDVFKGSTGPAFVCRSAVGICDEADVCNGTGPNCPPDAYKPAGTQCRSASGVCDVAETCTGTQYFCPPNQYAPPSQVCRAAATPCDAAETCTGGSTTCPPDTVAGPSTICRPSAGPCDLAEYCSGSSFQCPADQTAGDGDADSVCDSADNCPQTPNPSQADADGDDFGDACDICTAIGGSFTTGTKLLVSGILRPAGFQKLRYQGELIVPTSPALDLIAKGARVLITDQQQNVVLDATLPAGAYSTTGKAGWKVNRAGTTFSYKSAGNPTPRVNGIKKMSVKQVPTTPGRIKFSVRGTNGAYPVFPSELPVRATIVVEGAQGTNGQCGDSVFGVNPPGPICVLTGSASALTCR